MKRNAIVSVGLLSSLMVAPVGRSAESEPTPRAEEPTTYESPVLSLILLPVNVLIKMASLLGPSAKQEAPSSTPPADEAK